MGEFAIKTPVFEGPLDLLLDLIEKRKLHINDISLSQVADDFVSHINNADLQIGDIAHFVLTASTLLLIKSKSLLPALSLSKEEEIDIAELENRLKVLEKVKKISLDIKSIFLKTPLFTQYGYPKRIPVFAPQKNMNLANLEISLKSVLNSMPEPKASIPRAIVKKVISLEEVIENLSKRVQGAIKLSFNEFAGNKVEKTTIIVSFLAMLELVKQGIVSVTQSDKFSDIEIETDTLQVPTII